MSREAILKLLARFVLFCSSVSFLPSCSAHYARVDAITDELAGMSPAWVSEHRDTFRGALATTLAQDAYVCDPLPSEVFGGDGPEGWRSIHGTMPHYGVYYGPMGYAVLHADGSWRVEVRYAVEVPRDVMDMELPDCALAGELEGPVVCEGVPYSQSGTLYACPDSGVFRATTTPHNVRVLLARWSRDAERYYNRDAERFGLPITYDFTFEPIDPGQAADGPVHLRLPLSTTCGRTPYFRWVRSGWSMPILAHEVGHMLGLLDEYEMLSGIVDLYPKTPFQGAERSRFGLSMKEDTVVLPLHHYLVLRRYFCPEPGSRDPYAHALPSWPFEARIPGLHEMTSAASSSVTRMGMILFPVRLHLPESGIEMQRRGGG